MNVRLWFSKGGEPARPWLVQYDDGRQVRAAAVRLSNAETSYDEKGFLELRGGPKAVMRGDLEWLWDALPVEEPS